MGLEVLNEIDIVATDSSGNVYLVITDHYEWDNERQHVHLLQEKINFYLGIVEEGEIYKDYPNVTKNQIFIETIFKFEPMVSAIIFLEKCKEIVDGLGIGFSWKTHQPG